MSSWDRPHPEGRPEGREPLPDKAGESPLLSRSGGEKGLRGGGAGKPRCSSRGRPGFRGTLWVASRVSRDRKSTRLNSSHQKISYAVFCLKKKKKRKEVMKFVRVEGV